MALLMTAALLMTVAVHMTAASRMTATAGVPCGRLRRSFRMGEMAKVL